MNLTPMDRHVLIQALDDFSAAGKYTAESRARALELAEQIRDES